MSPSIITIRNEVDNLLNKLTIPKVRLAVVVNRDVYTELYHDECCSVINKITLQHQLKPWKGMR